MATIVNYLATPLGRMGLLRKSATALALMLLVGVGAARAEEGSVSSGLVNSDQTYVINDQGESVQEYGIGQLVYVVLDTKESKDKKHKDFYRVTFDPTNLKGDGWILRDKVKLMTAYRSIDGKEPKEYERKAAPIAPRGGSSSSVASGGAPSSDASSFLEELVKKDEQKPELKSITKDGGPPPVKVDAPKKNEKNPFENDLEFLFEKQDGEFKKTFKEAKASVKQSMQKKVGVSKFTAGGDPFANQMLDTFAAKMQKDGVSNIARVGYVANLDDAASVTIPDDLDGVFYGQISPKIGEARLLKVKYYDKTLKQFTFEKVAKIPLTDPTKTVETLAHDCYQFVSK